MYVDIVCITNVNKLYALHFKCHIDLISRMTTSTPSRQSPVRLWSRPPATTLRPTASTSTSRTSPSSGIQGRRGTSKSGMWVGIPYYLFNSHGIYSRVYWLYEFIKFKSLCFCKYKFARRFNILYSIWFRNELSRVKKINWIEMITLFQAASNSDLEEKILSEALDGHKIRNVGEKVGELDPNSQVCIYF